MNNLIILALAVVIGSGIGWQVRDWQATEDQLAATQKSFSELKTGLVESGRISAEQAEVSRNLEDLFVAMDATDQQVEEAKEKEYDQNIVYSKCIVPDSGMQLINRAVDGFNTGSDSRKRESAVR